MSQRPEFDFEVPAGYDALLERTLMAFADNGPLRPWRYVGAGRVIDLQKVWPKVESPTRLVAFARREDNDDYACFAIEGTRVVGVTLVHVSSDGYRILESFRDFWDWFRAVVVEDLVEWEARED